MCIIGRSEEDEGRGWDGGCCILWSVWSQQEKNHNHLYLLVQNTESLKSFLCVVAAYQHIYTTVTHLALMPQIVQTKKKTPYSPHQSSPSPNTLFSAWGGTRWLMFCDVTVDSSSENFWLSSRLPSHVESLLRSATDLIFQECKLCFVFLLLIHQKEMQPKHATVCTHSRTYNIRHIWKNVNMRCSHTVTKMSDIL